MLPYNTIIIIIIIIIIIYLFAKNTYNTTCKKNK